MTKGSPLHAMLIGINVASGLVALLLVVLLIANMLVAAKPVPTNNGAVSAMPTQASTHQNASIPSMDSPQSDTTPPPVVVDDSMVMKLGDTTMLVEDDYAYINYNDCVYRASLSDGSIQTLYENGFFGVVEGVEFTEENMIAYFFMPKTIALIQDDLYISINFQSKYNLLLRIPLTGGEAEFIMGVPTTSKMVVHGDKLHFLDMSNLTTYDPSSRTVSIQQLAIPAAEQSQVNVWEDDLYYCVRDTANSLSLYRYSFATGASEQVVAPHGVLSREGSFYEGVMVGNMYYGKSYDANRYQYLLAYDLQTGTTNVLDTIYDVQNLTTVRDVSVFYDKGGIFYKRDNDGGYARYDIASGEISNAYDLASEYSFSNISTSYGMTTVYESGTINLVDLSTTEVLHSFQKGNSSVLSGLSTNNIMQQANDIVELLERDTVYVLGGESYPLQR